jgi:hypothetical protein
MMKKNSKKSKTDGDELIHTYQTRLCVSPEIENALSDCAAHLSRVERSLFAKIQKLGKLSGENLNQTKSYFLAKFGISGRHFNSIRVFIQGKIDSYRSNLDRYINDTSTRIEVAKKTIEKLTKKEVEPSKRKKHLINRHHKKRRLARQEKRLEQLESDKASGRTQICFGSKKLFNAQFDLEANRYESFEDWKEDWQKARSNQFILIGSKDETAGNQLCTAIRQKDGSLTLRVRMPESLTSVHGKYVEIDGVKFEYGQDVIEAALNDNEARRVLKNLKRDSQKSYGQAISYRFYVMKTVGGFS